jgi:pyrimidine-nucleoside phosphorylase
MRMLDIIAKKRLGGKHTDEEIAFVVKAASDPKAGVPDYQLTSWLMAVCCRGMDETETAALTRAMALSGRRLDLKRLSAPKVDKHSTGGVGDKTSLILAPIVAAGGLYVPMISGRGLGHTGGTLDKLESIPGFNVNLSLADFRRVLRECGMALIGQTAEIAPADKKIYALRDVTATVENLSLICASIMSKKLAEGIDALVLDVKTGSGAFMKKEEDSVRLAELMVETGRRMGKKVAALITDMNQPLGRFAGHTVEVIECIEVLHGRGAGDLRDLSLDLSAWMFFLGGRTPSVAEGRRLAESLIADGKALEKFRRCVDLQGGDPRVVDDPVLLPKANLREEIPSARSGFIVSTKCEQFGTALAVLGGGREKKEDSIDHAVGLEFHKRIGDRVAAGEPLVTVFYNDEDRFAAAKPLLAGCCEIGAEPPREIPRLIKRLIGESA